MAMKQKVGGPALGEVKSPFAESLLDKKGEEEKKGFWETTREAFRQLKIRTLEVAPLTSKEEMKDIEMDIERKKGGRNAHLIDAGIIAFIGGGATLATSNPIVGGVTLVASSVVAGLSIMQHRNASLEEGEYNKRTRHTSWKNVPDTA